MGTVTESKSSSSTSRSSSSASKASTTAKSEKASSKSPTASDRISAPDTTAKAAAVGNTSQLNAVSGKVAASETTSELAEVQAKAASKASGEPATDARTEQYQEMSDLKQRAESGDPEAAAMAGAHNVHENTAILRDIAQGEFREANDGVDASLGRVAEVNAMGAKVLAEQGSVLKPDERARLEAYTQEEVGKVTPDVEAASTKLAGQLEDPLLRESFQDWSKQDKLEFYDSISKNLAFSESGRESLKDFGDGLGGKSDNPFAAEALELRDSLSGEERDRLDKALGLATGAGGASVSDILQGSKPYQDAVSVGGSVKDLVIAVAPDAADLASHGLLTGRGARVVGNLAGPVGAVIDAVNLADQLQKGDAVGAFGSVAGITGAGLGLAGSSLAGPVGAVALGVDVYQALDESSKYNSFVQTGLDQAMGADHPLREVVGQMNESGLNRLEFDKGEPLRPQLESRAEQYWGPQWQDYATKYREPSAELFWAEADHARKTQALQEGFNF